MGVSFLQPIQKHMHHGTINPMQDDSKPGQAPAPAQQPTVQPVPDTAPVPDTNPAQTPAAGPQVTSTDPLLLQPKKLEKNSEPEPELGEGKAKTTSTFREIGAFVGILGTAGILALLLITFVFRSYAVDGPSMETTLQNADKLIIWKWPRTWAGITGHQYVPQRGDVVIFTEDDLSACGQVGSRQIIKRVIALPGEHVTIQDGHYEVFNKDNPGGFDPDKTLPYNKDGHVPDPTGDVDVTLASNQIFVSGDNRPNSCDSRAFGPIQTKQIIGKLVLRLLPANKMQIF